MLAAPHQKLLTCLLPQSSFCTPQNITSSNNLSDGCNLDCLQGQRRPHASLQGKRGQGKLEPLYTSTPGCSLQAEEPVWLIQQAIAKAAAATVKSTRKRSFRRQNALYSPPEPGEVKHSHFCFWVMAIVTAAWRLLLFEVQLHSYLLAQNHHWLLTMIPRETPTLRLGTWHAKAFSQFAWSPTYFWHKTMLKETRKTLR